jgi:ribosomal protein S18 acetylase RimI-like enzyme
METPRYVPMTQEPAPLTITIGPAKEAEYAFCADLMVHSEPWITLGRQFDDRMTGLKRLGTELFIAREGDQPVGFVHIHPYGFAGSPFITTIAVSHSLRGRGIGSQLLAFAEAHEAGRRFIFLCVSSFNPRAQELYYRLGYVRVGELPNYIIEGHTELFLCKKLP